MDSHPELQESAKELCGAPIEIHSEVFPEYAVFAYDAVTTVAMGIQGVFLGCMAAPFSAGLISAGYFYSGVWKRQGLVKQETG